MTPAEATAAVAEHGGVRAAARALGVPYSTMQSRIRSKARQHRAEAKPAPAARSGARRPLPSRGMPIGELLSARERAFERKARAESAEAWAPVRIPDPLPVAVLWFGDPHIDDDGCNLPLLRRHVELCRTTPGLSFLTSGRVRSGRALV